MYYRKEHNTWEDTNDIDLDDRPQMLEEGDEDLDLEEDFYQQHPDAPCHTDALAQHK